jgi:predicted nucleic acid-binding protein
MSAEVFLDTNILVYAHDRQAGSRHQRAAALLQGFWDRGERPALGVQVLQELYVNLVRKGLSLAQARAVVEPYFAWRVVDHTKALVRDAFTLQARWKFSYWDAAILAAAHRAGVPTLWSEDFSPGQSYGGVTAVNPLVES